MPKLTTELLRPLVAGNARSSICRAVVGMLMMTSIHSAPAESEQTTVMLSPVISAPDSEILTILPEAGVTVGNVARFVSAPRSQFSWIDIAITIPVAVDCFEVVPCAGNKPSRHGYLGSVITC